MVRPRQLVARCPRLKDQGGLRQQRDWSPSPELALQDEDGCVPWPRARLPHLLYQPIGKWGAGPRTRARMNWQSLQAPGRRRVGKKEAQTMFYKHRLHCGGWAVGVSLLSGSRTRRPARSAAPAAPLGGRWGRHCHSPAIQKGVPPRLPHHSAGPSPLGSRSISSSSSSSPSSISSGLACCASSASSSRDASLLGWMGAAQLSWA